MVMNHSMKIGFSFGLTSGIITTLGLNWYANPNVKFQLAYSMVDLNVNANSDGDYIYWDEDNPTLNRYPDGYDFNYLQFMTILFF